MIDLYYWTTPNGHKITMFLEETGLPYRIVPVNIGSGAQFEPAFLAISPNNRIPAIVDHAPADSGAALPVFESGAILMYLAEKSGRLLPRQLRARVEVTQWLFWQLAGLGPMAGQNHHFSRYAPEKIADIAAYPWIVPSEAQGQKLEDFPHLQRWFNTIRERPATLRAYAKAQEINTHTELTEEARRVLFAHGAR